MVGEIRDRETAEIAIQASLTGHLVFSTLHTNDAAGAVTRLVDMGVEPFLVASSLIGASWRSGWCGACASSAARTRPPGAEELAQIGLEAASRRRRGRSMPGARAATPASKPATAAAPASTSCWWWTTTCASRSCANADAMTIRQHRHAPRHGDAA